MAHNEDESVRIAVRALGDMRNSGHTSSFQPTPALSATSGTSSPSLPSPSLGPQENGYEDVAGIDNRLEGRQGEDADFVSRMSSFPIVNSALRAYEHGKASSRVVKYGAEMMESSVKSISRPVIERLPVGQIDEFACRQLDRLETYTRRNPSQDRDREEERGRSLSVEYDRNFGRHPEQWDTRDESMVRDDSRGRHPQNERWREGSSASTFMQTEDRQPRQYSLFPSQSSHDKFPPTLQLPPQYTHQQSRSSPAPATSAQAENQQVAQRSRWQTVLREAGGISAALSEESMRRLRYCLQWLQYATAHIDAQIVVLRNFIASLQSSSSSLSQSHPSVLVSQQHLRTLNTAKRDVVDTLRQVVNVVSRYAGGALPEPARSTVRTFILRLPRRWAEAAGVDPQSNPSVDGGRTGGGADRTDVRRANGSTAPYSYGPGEHGPSSRSRPPSRTASPAHSRAHSRQASGSGFGSGNGAGSGSGPTTTDAANQAAQRILTLATESLDMLLNVTSIVSESLDRADAWVERLRVVGLQRQQNGDAEGRRDSSVTRTDPMLDFRDAHSRFSSDSSQGLYAPRQSHAYSQPHSPSTSHFSSPFSASAANSGQTTPVYGLSRNSSSSLLSMGPPGSMSSYYSADAGGAAASLNALSLSSHSHSHSASGSVASSRFATPKSVLAGLPPEGDGGGGVYMSGQGAYSGSRGEKRSAEGDDPTVVAATALAGLASSAKRAKQDRGRDNADGMDVDG